LLHPISLIALRTLARHARSAAHEVLSVLWVLTERAGQIVTKEEVFRKVWPDTAVSDSALTSCIQELRQALRDDARRPRFIETIHRRGYRFLTKTSPVSRTEAQPILPVLTHADAPVVGREGVLNQMREIWELAARGNRRCFQTGEPGIGKTAVAGLPLQGLCTGWSYGHLGAKCSALRRW
jgi:DNA-binding winged helix-turn-helix (wHTH) protein